MARQDIDIGVEGNDGTGDSIRESFRKVNENFTEIYAVFGVEGSLSFLSLGDTPSEFEANKILTTNGPGNALIFSSITSNDGTIGIDVVSTPGEIDLSVRSIQIVDDTETPTLGNHLNAANKAIGGLNISAAAAADLSNRQGVSYTIDDLAITKGYADRRYVTSGLPIRVAAEPENTDSFILTIDSYNDSGHLVFNSGHGYDSGANGTAFVFDAEDSDPTGLVSGTTYFIRYETDTELSIFTDQEIAQTEDQNEADTNKIGVSGTIAIDDTHIITDAGFDANLTGNFLSDVAMPRDSITRRQGDTMAGELYLSDHPGELAGAGTPNGAQDLQAATKYYVDNTAYSSPEVLFVSTAGDDTMSGVPVGKEGTAATYAYRTINAAAQRASELINTAPEEPGPYFQTLSFGATPTTAGTAATVISAAVETAVNQDTRSIIQNNREFIIKEITGFKAFTYPNIAYDIDKREDELGLILDAVSFDATRGNTANYLSRTSAERYYSSVEGRVEISGDNFTRTDSSFAKTLEIVQAVLQNALLNPKTVTAITKKSGDTPASVTTSTAHGLSDSNQVIFKDVSGMTEIEDVILFVKVIDTGTFELFTDATLETAYDNSAFTTFVNDGNAKIGLRYQDKLSQDTSVAGISPSANGYVAVTQNFTLIRNIIRNGPDSPTAADIAFGNRYELDVTNSTGGILDQTDPDNVDALPGKVIVGKRSGAIGRIITYNQDTNSTSFYLQPLEAKDFEPGEELEMGNFVKSKQVVIRVESGIYEEDYPIKLTKNVSLKGDEFRRVIIRPKRRVSQSPFANTYFYRDKEFDGITLLTTGTPFTNQTGQVQGFFGYHYLLDNTKPLNVGAAVTNAGGYVSAYNILKLNKTFIQAEVGEYVNVTYPGFFSSESRVTFEKNIGLVVDALIYDLERGNSEGVLEIQGEYYTGALVPSPGAEAETEDAIDQISNIAGDLLAGVDPAGNGFDRSSTDVDLDGGIAEPEWTASTSYEQGDFVKNTVGDTETFYKALVSHTSEASDVDGAGAITNTDRWEAVPSSINLVGDLIDVVNFAFDSNYNPPKRNDADGVDVFLMDDATIIRNVTVQGHGGFMCVLDPEGQILTKSPYIQTASSFSRSRNAKAFSGGMFVDAFCGNIPMRIQANSGNYTDSASTVALDAFTLYVESQDVNGEDQGLKLRLPELPAPFYFEGQRYQVNAISNYDSATGRAVIYLDPGSNSGNGWNKSGSDDIGDPGHDNNDTIQDIFLQTAGNRSILGNDFTQINDLGYGLVTTNGAFSEMVSMFTYYCQAAYYAANGSEIRSLNGSNGYGNFGLVAEGADPNEIPDEVTTLRNMVQPVKSFTYSGFTNAFEDTTITVYDFKEPPMSNSFILIDHGGLTGPLNYRISRVENLSDPNNDGTIGAAGAVLVTGIETVDNASVAGSVPAGTATYTGVSQKATTGTGTGAEFTVEIAAGSATFTITNVGSGYETSDTISISGADIGGSTPANDLSIDVSSVYQNTPGTYIAAGSDGNITAATQASPVVITSASHNLSNGDKITISGVGGMEQLNNNSYFVGNVATNTFELYSNQSQTSAVDGTEFTAYTSGGSWAKASEIGNHVYRLTIQEAGSNIDFFADLQDTVNHDTFIEYRHGENFIFTGVANPGSITERPSTAINFDESDLTTYRSTGFTQADDQGVELGSDEVKATFDDSYDYPVLSVDFANISTTDPDDGAKTLGATIADTKIAVLALDNTETELRIVADANDATNQNILYPGDVGYGGGMIFAYQGKILQIIDYDAITQGNITAITQTDPAVITSAGHNLVNGNSIEIRDVGGMTDLNGNTFFVGNVTTDTFELYTDNGLSNGLDSSVYDAYTSGGRWIASDSVWYIEVQDYQTDGADWDITGTSANNGIKTAFTTGRDLYLGLQAGSTSEITIAISLLRATGHDFTQIGTGGFNTSNYPNVLLGAPIESKAGAYSDEDNANKAQVWERRKGRVFFISSDEDGFFRVGKYFVVDQSTGSITFSGEVGISRAANLGFRDGVTISEFSNDELFTDLSDTAVPTEKAIANYVSRRLGHNGSIQLTGSARFDPGFMTLDGSTKMEANMNMNSKQIKNLLDPTDDNDAATKDYVVQATQSYDELDDLRNITIHDRAGSGDEQKQVLVPTGYKRLTVDPLVGTIEADDILEDGSSTATVIATESRFDYSLNQDVQIITYDLLTGTGFNTTLTPVYVTSVGTKSATVLENPIDEFTNAREDSASDINITTIRTTPDTTINLQIASQAILNSDVNDDAGISQSKLMMNRAKPLADSTNLYGTDQDGGISATATIINITQASPAVVETSGDHGLSNNELVQISDVVGMTELNGNSYYVDVLSSVTFALYENSGPSGAVNTGGFTAYVSGGIAAGEATGTGRTGQSSRGLAAFEADSFAEDVKLTLTTATISAAAGDILYQGDPDGSAVPTGYVVASVSGSSTVIIRTTDTWVVDSTAIYKSTVTNGVAGTATNTTSTVFAAERSGYINLRDRGVAYEKLPDMTGGNLADVYGGSVIGRATDGDGAAEEVSFATVIDQGKGLSDDDFTTERDYWSNPPTNTVPNDPGLALIQYGTAGGGTYAYTDIAYDNTGNSIVKRNITGAVHVGSLIVGSDPSYTILSEASAELTMKTPEQGTIFTSSGSSKPTINTGGVVRVGDIGAYSESSLHKASDFGTVGGAESEEGAGDATTETSALAARWIYSSFIEAPDEKDATGTGIGIGAGIGKGLGGADKIAFVTGGNVEARVTTTGLEADDVRSMNANTDLTLTANGSGSVYVDDTLKLSGNITKGTGTITVPNNTSGTIAISVSDTTTTTQGDLNLDFTLSASGNVSATGDAHGLGTGDNVEFAQVKTTDLTTGGSSTAGTVTGNWTLTTGSRFEATYADLAEYYEADNEYDFGTVVVFGGEKEVTHSTEHRSTRVAGVVSENPAYTMNQACPGIATPIALQGRVPCKVIGKVNKGDMLVASAIAGYAIVDNDPRVGTVIGKAVGEKLDADKGIVEVVVGRV